MCFTEVTHTRKTSNKIDFLSNFVTTQHSKNKFFLCFRCSKIWVFAR